MTLSELKTILPQVTDLNFQLPDGSDVAKHFHVTEVGQVNKHFIDCGGTERLEKTVSFQLWEADDYDHRLAPKKLTDIISLSERVLSIEDAEIEVEYQGNTIGKYGLEWDGKNFQLTSKKTACLAEDKCGIPAHNKQKIKLQDLSPAATKTSCTPGGGCC